MTKDITEVEIKVEELERKQQDLLDTIKVLTTDNKALRGDVRTLEVRVKDLFSLTNSNSTLGGEFFTGDSSRNASTGDQAITGVGFTPSLIIINAVYSHATEGVWSIGTTSTVNNTWTLMKRPSGYNSYNDTDELISIKVGANYNVAKLKSLDDDGFTLDWTLSNDLVSFNYTCFA